MRWLRILLLASVVNLGIQSGLFAKSTRETIEYALPRVVKLFGAGGLRGLAGYGTGFLVSKDGHIATAWSHILDADQVSVVLDDGRRFEAKLIGAEPQLDIAVLKIENLTTELDHFELSTAKTVAVGQRVLAFSNMFNVAAGDEPVSVLHGVVAAKTDLAARRGAFQIPYDGPVYIMDAITNNPGAAGGIVLTRTGELVGVIGKEVRNARSNTWVNYAIPLPVLTKTIDAIIAGTYVEDEKPDEDAPDRYRPLDFGLVMVPDVVFRTPAYIESVLPGTAAASQGLQPDDLVLFVDNELVQSARELKRKLGALESGDRFEMIVRRKNRLITIQLTAPKKSDQ
ncbi:S1C family serine protease [Thalassoroseus pseudoceratinae]|uniref:S1C family serine protease n=1 Tax=Thalassoroseus pseudoceratinae TaxID=2713176 RepID=UPI00141F3F4A|nr:trypsin-like peptidase domain-containing protein [Thalassoroseus pseudoceratinae]